MREVVYVLWGYHLPKGCNQPICLLVDPENGELHSKSIKSPLGRQANTFRQHFKNEDPPFPFTWVSENVITGELCAVPECDQPRPHVDGLTRRWASLTLSEDCITESIFAGTDGIKKARNADLNMWAQTSERDLIMTTLFKQSYLRQIRVNLIKLLNYKQTTVVSHHKSTTASTIVHLPPSIDSLFIQFDPIDPGGGVDKYGYGADFVAMRHKIIKFVVEDMCPFARVALGRTMSMEMCLSRCLPTGSAGKGCEIFSPSKVLLAEASYVVAGAALMYKSSDFTRINSMTACGISDSDCTLVDPLNAEDAFFQWKEYDVVSGTTRGEAMDTDGDKSYYKDPINQIALIASTFKVGETDGFFDKGSVVFTNHEVDNPLAPFACVDLSNFYATVVEFFELDAYVAKVMRAMTLLRNVEPEMKRWIVSILGKAKHFDPVLFRRMKDLSVATVLSIVNRNKNFVMGATTDGILVNARLLPFTMAVPVGFGVKTEFIPNVDRPMLTLSPTSFVGYDSRNDNVFHRGFVGRGGGGQPAFYRDLIDVVLNACMEVKYGEFPLDEAIDLTARSLTEIMSSKSMMAYELPEVCPSVRCTEEKGRRIIDYVINDLCVDSHQFYAIVDDHVVPSSCLTTNHVLPVTLSGYCLKQLNVPKYVAVLKDKLNRVIRAFDYHPPCSKVCREAFKVMKYHIHTTLPSDRTSYPGGVGTG